jgi:hypothetical protein
LLRGPTRPLDTQQSDGGPPGDIDAPGLPAMAATGYRGEAPQAEPPPDDETPPREDGFAPPPTTVDPDTNDPGAPAIDTARMDLPIAQSEPLAEDLYGHLDDRDAGVEGDLFAGAHLDVAAMTGLRQLVDRGDVDPPSGTVAGDLDVEAVRG